jgi:hypothetical protein
MKSLALLIPLCLTACSHPVPYNGWESLAWRYTGRDGKVCGEMAKQAGRNYSLGVFDNDGRPIFSTILSFDSEQDAKTFFEAVCAKRTK